MRCGRRCSRRRRRDEPFHVGVLLDNVPEYVFLLGGAALAGAAVVGINPTRRGAELAHDIRHTDCGLVVTEAAHRPLLDGLDLGIDDDRIVTIESDTWHGWCHAYARVAPRGAPGSRDTVRPDLHVGVDRRAQSRARNPGALREHGRAHAVRSRRRPVLPDAAVPRQRAGVELRPRADLRRGDRVAAPVLRVRVPRRPAPRGRDVLQHGRSRAVVRARNTAILRRPQAPGQVRARARVVTDRHERVPRTIRHTDRRRLRLQRGRDHHHAGTRPEAGRARPAPGRDRRRRRRSPHPTRSPARGIRREWPADERRARDR